MQWITYEAHGQAAYGLLAGDQVLPLAGRAGFPGSLPELIESGPHAWDEARALASSPGEGWLPRSALRLLAPIPRPGKVIGIGLNYLDHCREQNVRVPDHPIVFAKFSSSIVGPGERVTWDPELTQQVDFEAELAVVIGRTARRVSPADALDYVFGYTCLNDLSARDLQTSDRQWVRAKSLDGFCPTGPAITPAADIPNPQALRIGCRVNGDTRQDSSTAEMIFPVAELIAELSRAFTLLPGDLISTGTPNGVGMFRQPPVYLQPGDVVEVEIERIGVLRTLIG